MPILRLPADDTLGSTLGSLGQQLANNLNPRNAAEAQLLQRQIWLRNLELQEKMRQQQAQQQALRGYQDWVTPEALPLIANSIYRGDDSKMTFELAMRNMKVNPFRPGITPEDDQYNRDMYRKITGNFWDKNTPVPTNAAQAAEANRIAAQQKGAEAGATKTGELDAEKAARARLTIPSTGDPQQDAANQRGLQVFVETGSWPPGTGPNGVAGEYIKRSLDAQSKAFDAAVKPYYDTLYARPPVGQPAITPNQLPPLPTIPGPNAAVLPSQAAAVPPPLPVPGAPPTGGGPAPIIPGAGGGGPVPPVPGAPPAVPGAPPTAPTTAQAPGSVTYGAPPIKGTEGYAIPAQEVATGAGGTSLGELPEVTKQRLAIEESRKNELMGAYGNITNAQDGLTMMDRAMQLTRLLDNKGLINQLGLQGAKDAYERFGLTLGDEGGARLALDQILKTQYPQLAKQMQIVRMAKPEIQLLERTVGDANMPPNVLLPILGKEKILLQMEYEKGVGAGKVLGWNLDPGQAPSTYDQWQAGNKALADSFPTRYDQMLKDVRALGIKQPEAPSVFTVPKAIASSPETAAAGAPPAPDSGGGPPVVPPPDRASGPPVLPPPEAAAPGGIGAGSFFGTGGPGTGPNLLLSPPPAPGPVHPDDQPPIFLFRDGRAVLPPPSGGGNAPDAR